MCDMYEYVRTQSNTAWSDCDKTQGAAGAKIKVVLYVHEQVCTAFTHCQWQYSYLSTTVQMNTPAVLGKRATLLTVILLLMPGLLMVADEVN